MGLFKVPEVWSRVWENTGKDFANLVNFIKLQPAGKNPETVFVFCKTSRRNHSDRWWVVVRAEGRPQQGVEPRALSLSLLLFCCDNWKHGVDIVFLGYSQDIPATPSPHQGISILRFRHFLTSLKRVWQHTCLIEFLTGLCFYGGVSYRLTVSPGAEVCFVGNQSDDDRTISCWQGISYQECEYCQTGPAVTSPTTAIINEHQHSSHPHITPHSLPDKSQQT